MYLLPPIPNMEDYSGSDRAVTTCQLPLQTVGIIHIQQLLANLDTMSTLVRDTLVDSQNWHLPKLTGRADRSDRSGLYSLSRIRVFVESPHVILLVKGYVFPGL